jgi:hypothetical protein
MVQIRIGNIVWNVYPVCRGDERLQSAANETVLGITYFQEAEIYICTDNTNPYILKRTIRHELCHAALFSCGFTADTMNEEDICNFFESNAEEICEKSEDVYTALADADQNSKSVSSFDRMYTNVRPSMA